MTRRSNSNKISMSLNINGENESVTVAADTPLLWVLRDHVGLVGAKFGCGAAMCGACTVNVDGKAIRSCVIPAAELRGKKIETIEGLAQGNKLHPLQKAWIDKNVPQCGYCQPGQIMAAKALLKAKSNVTSDDIDKAMSGNLCRCGTYPRIKEAIISVSKGNHN